MVIGKGIVVTDNEGCRVGSRAIVRENESEVMWADSPKMTEFGHLLQTSRIAKACELVVVLGAPLGMLLALLPWASDNLFAKFGVICLANALAVAFIWAALCLRRQSWRHFGLSIGQINLRSFLRLLGQSAVVFLVGVLAFAIAAVVMANVVGMPEQADMSRYEYLQGNFLLLAASLVAIYVFSSFGEEVIYRGFLINRAAELGGGVRSSWMAAVAISSVVFGAVHSDWGLAGMVQATAMGLALGASYLAVGRNLWVTILAHAAMDTLLIVPFYFG